MTVQEIIDATLRGSPYLRSCGHDAVTHAVAQKAFNEGGTVAGGNNAPQRQYSLRAHCGNLPVGAISCQNCHTL